AYVPKAFIAIEDRRFYAHHGVDPWGIMRAVVANVLHRGVAQGGSTITQQLAKNLFLTQERTLSRKLQEVVLAMWLGPKFKKQQNPEPLLHSVQHAADPRALSQPGLLRCRRLRRRGGRAALLRQVGEERDAGGSGAARRSREIAVAALADEELRRRRKARAARARRDERLRLRRSRRRQGR